MSQSELLLLEFARKTP